MSTAHTTLFYGVYVKTGYLCFASDAYKEAKGSLLAIDLVCSRRRKGTLSTAPDLNMVVRVPEEVWKMIKLEVVASAVEEAKQDALDLLERGYATRGAGDRIKREWKHDSLSDAAIEGLFNDGGMSDMIHSRSKVSFTLRLARARHSCCHSLRTLTSSSNPLDSRYLPMSLTATMTCRLTTSTLFPRSASLSVRPCHTVPTLSLTAFASLHDTLVQLTTTSSSQNQLSISPPTPIFESNPFSPSSVLKR